MAKKSTLITWSENWKERVQGPIIPTLESERLQLRAPCKADFQNNYLLSSDPDVMRYITFGKVQSPQEAREDLLKRIRLSRGQYGYWITEEKQSGDFVGWVVLKKFEKTNDFELGFRFTKAQWGRGFATEAGRRVIRYAFEVLRFEKVLAVVMPENNASRRVLEKIGFQLTGFGSHYNTHCAIYQIIRGDTNYS